MEIAWIIVVSFNAILLLVFFLSFIFSAKANEAAIGRCYEPSEQIPHGGMVFDYGEKIPFYNPGESFVCLISYVQ